MKDLVVIYLHRNDFNSGDFRDLLSEEIRVHGYLDELKKYASSVGKKILFTMTPPEHRIAELDNFAEIRYTGALSENEKSFYKDFLRRFMRDWEYLPHGYAEEVSLPFTIVYERVAEAAFVEA